MTIINRALDKAYRRHSEAEPGARTDSRAPAVRGWASKLRDPLRPIQPPAGSVANPTPAEQDMATVEPEAPAASPSSEPQLTASPLAAVSIPIGTKTRLDSPHAPAPATAPALLEIQPAAFLPAQTLIAERPADEEPRIEAATAWAWPPIVDKLLDCPAGAELRKFAARLNQLALGRNLGCLAFSGPGRGAGRTSLLLALAHVLAEKHAARVAVIDADFQNPQVAQMLSVHPKSGLWDAASQAGPVVSAVTTLIPEKLTLVPLVEPVVAEAIDSEKIERLQAFLQAVRSEHDLILVDAGPWEAIVPPLLFESGTIDAFLCVSRHDAAMEERLDDDAYRQPGVDWLGMIETFTPAAHLQARCA